MCYDTKNMPYNANNIQATGIETRGEYFSNGSPRAIVLLGELWLGLV